MSGSENQLRRLAIYILLFCAALVIQSSFLARVLTVMTNEGAGASLPGKSPAWLWWVSIPMGAIGLVGTLYSLVAMFRPRR